MKNVMIVDDDSVFNFLNTKVLELIGDVGDIKTAMNGLQALDLLQTHYMDTFPDVILLDLDMPIMSGFEFLKAFNMISSPGKDNVNIIVVTSSQNKGDLDRVKELGVKRYLTKPLTKEHLMAAMAI